MRKTIYTFLLLVCTLNAVAQQPIPTTIQFTRQISGGDTVIKGITPAYQVNFALRGWVKDLLTPYKLNADTGNATGYLTRRSYLNKEDTILAYKHFNSGLYFGTTNNYLGNYGLTINAPDGITQIASYSSNSMGIFDQFDSGHNYYASPDGFQVNYGGNLYGYAIDHNTGEVNLGSSGKANNFNGVVRGSDPAGANDFVPLGYLGTHYSSLNSSNVFNGSQSIYGQVLLQSASASFDMTNDDFFLYGDNTVFKDEGGSVLLQLGNGADAALSYTPHLQVVNAASVHNDVLNKGTGDSLYVTKSGTINIPRLNTGDSTINQSIIWRGNSQTLAIKRADVVSNSQSYACISTQALGYRQVNQGWGGRKDQQSTAVADSSLFYTVTRLPLPDFKPGTLYVLGVFANDIPNDTTHYTPALWQAQMIAVVDTLIAHGISPSYVILHNPGYEGGYLGYPNHSADMESRHNAYYAAMQNVAAATGCLYYDDWTAMKPFASQYVTTIDFIHLTVAGNAWEAGRFTTFLQSHFTPHPWTVKNNVYGNQYIEGNLNVQNSITTNQLNVNGGAEFPFVEVNGQLHSRNADHSGNTSNFVAGGDITGHSITNGVNKYGNIRGYTYADTTDFLPLISYSSTSTQSIEYIGYDSKSKYTPTDIVFAVSATPATATASVPAMHIFPSGGITISTVTETDPGAGNLRLAGNYLFKNDNLYTVGTAAMNAATVYSRVFRSGSTLTLTAGGTNGLVITSGTGQLTMPFYTTAGILHNSATGLITTAKITSGDADATIMTTSAGRVGQTTLAAGTKSITITGLTASSIVTTSFAAAGGTTSATWQYKAVCTTNTLTITAITNTGATDTTDTSTINYIVVN